MVNESQQYTSHYSLLLKLFGLCFGFKSQFSVMDVNNELKELELQGLKLRKGADWLSCPVLYRGLEGYFLSLVIIPNSQMSLKNI